MIGAMYSATSALQAHSTALNVTANNIANLNTRDYTAKSTSLAEMKNGGVKVAAVRDSVVAPHIRPTSGDSEAFIAQRMSNASIDIERMQEIISLRAFQASAKTITTTDEMLGTIVNMKA